MYLLWNVVTMNYINYEFSHYELRLWKKSLWNDHYQKNHYEMNAMKKVTMKQGFPVFVPWPWPSRHRSAVINFIIKCGIVKKWFSGVLQACVFTLVREGKQRWASNFFSTTTRWSIKFASTTRWSIKFTSTIRITASTSFNRETGKTAMYCGI